ncbi:MAG: pyridoxamine 5'-phosphate oxidase family protein [Oscillospiraceae bacterium]|jgi:general stress protein 26|nr:pyridoxamine 5'-phosphate oxidase family protein [Oscillospiraceae bacterium]
MHEESIKRAGEIIAQNTGADSHCTLALIDDDGYPTASTITASKSDGIKWITFGSEVGSNKANRIRKCNRAAVCFNRSGDHNITLVGTIEIVTDADVKRDMWYSGLENHFAGHDDPNFCVLRFTTKRYNLFVDWKDEVSGEL